MANKYRGEHAVEIDGRAYTLCFSTNALCELEAIWGSPMQDIAKALSREQLPSQIQLRALLWAALRDHHPDISLKDTGVLMDALGSAQTHMATLSAFIAAMPKRADGEASRDGSANPPVTPGTGNGS